MDVAVGTAVAGAVCGPGLARAAYQLSVPYGRPTRTACRHCREPLPTSWRAKLAWAGRCPLCDRPLGPRVWLVTLTALTAGALVGYGLGAQPAIVVFTVFAVLCVLLAFVDIAVRRLPDQLTGPAAAIGLAGLGGAAYVAWDAVPLLRGLIGAALAGGFFLGLAWLRSDGRGMGLGDAKLAGVLGLYLGWLGWRDLTIGFVTGTSSAALFAVLLLVTGRADRGSAFPYGPFLLLGAAVAIAAH